MTGVLPLAEPATAVLRSGLRARYRVEGPAGGGTVLALHGIGCGLEDFDAQHRLMRGRHRLLSIDLPGFGGSDRLPGGTSLAGLAAFVEELLDAVGPGGPVHVVGNSLGGAVAMQLTVQAPERVRTLVLANPAGFGRQVVWGLRLVSVPWLGRRLLRPSPAAARQTVLGIFADPDLATEERVQQAFERASGPHAGDVLAETVSALGTVWGVRPGWRRRLLPALAALGVPTLVVWGADDRVLPAAHLDAARRHLPHARTHSFPATGHMPQIERAEDFAALVEDFWARAAEEAP